MKQKLRIIALVAAGVMAAASMAGCDLYSDDTPSQATSSGASQTDTNTNAPELAATWPEFKEHRSVTISWMEQGWTGMEKDLDIVTPEIEKRTNLHLGYEPLTLTRAEDYTQRLNLMVAADEVPDIFFGNPDTYTRSIYDKLGNSGKIWDLTEIIKDYKGLYELVYPELNLYKTKDTKSNYFIPTQTGRGNELLSSPPHGMFFRKDYLDQLGMEYPDTPEEIAEFLRRCKAEIKVDGKSVGGFIVGEELGGLENLYQPFFPLIGDRDSALLPFDPNDNFKVKNYEFTNSPELMQAAKYINGLVTEGLMDRELLTIKAAQVQEKVTAGTIPAFASTWWDMNTYSDTAKATYPDLLYIAPPPVFASEQIKESRLRDWTNWVGCFSTMIISKDVDEASLRHLLALMDYLVTADGQMLVQAGIEGETYTIGSDGKYQYTDEFIKNTNNLDWNRCAAYGVSYYAQLVCNFPVISDKQATPANLLREDNKLSWENQKVNRDHYKGDMKPPKDYYFVAGEVENEKFPAIKDRKKEFWAKVVAAKSESEVESIVEEWGKTCKSMGIEEIMAERQTYIDTFVMTE